MKQLIKLIREETDFLKTLQEVTREDLQENAQCRADEIRDELREDGIDTKTEYDTVKNEDNKESVIL